jgi:hypothetical protein
MKRLTSLLRPRALALAAGTVAAMACGTASAQTLFTGSTLGCFGASCTPTATATLNGLTYTDSTFSVASAANGTASIGNLPATPNVNNLGSFSLTGALATYNTSFSLMITFTAPPGTSPNPSLFTTPLTGMVNGTASTTDNGGISIDFGSTLHHFTFGSGATAGSFDLELFGVALSGPPVNAPPNAVPLTGKIENVTTVPEPETYALFLAGLGAVGLVVRRRRR